MRSITQKITLIGLVLAGIQWLWVPAYAQSYRPLLSVNQWFVQEDAPSAQNFPWYSHPVDTTINGTVYTVIYRDNLPEPYYLREDTVARKVYAILRQEGWSERLLYDFSVRLMDTVRLEFLNSGGNAQVFTVNQIDSVNTAIGFVKRIRLMNTDFLGNPTQVDWVETVGNDMHPVYLAHLHEPSPVYHLVCNFQEGNKRFDDGFGTCPNTPPPLGVGEDFAGNISLRFAPNPATHIVRMSLPAVRDAWEITLFDREGRRVGHAQLPPGQEEFRYSTHKLPNGIYFFQVLSSQNLIANGKFSIFR